MLSENCAGCLQAKLIEKLDLRVSKLEEQYQSMQEKISDIEKNASAAEERTKTLFTMLDDIKKSIEKIANKIETLEKKPGDRWEEAIKTIVALAIGAAFMYFTKN